MRSGSTPLFVKKDFLLLAPYVDETYIAQKGLTLLGDADEAEELARRREAETLGRFSGGDGQEDVTGDEA